MGVTDLKREIQILRRLALCDNIIKIYSTFSSEKYVHLIMSYENGGTL